MKLFKWVFLFSIIALGIVVMRSEVNRSGRTIGQLHNEIDIKEARNQYLKLETQRLMGPEEISRLAREKLKLRRTPPSKVIQLEK